MIMFGLKLVFFVLINNFFVNSYQILAVLPDPIKSHFIFIDPLLVELARKGHQVTVYSAFKKNRAIPNYREYDTSDCPLSQHPMLPSIETYRSLFGGPFVSVLMFGKYSVGFVDQYLGCPPLKELLNSTMKFDLFITQSFDNDIPLIYAEKFKIPFITYMPNILFPWLSVRTQNPHNPAYMPDLQSGLLPKMTFLERLENTLVYLFGILVYNGYLMRNFEEVYRTILGHSTPSLYDNVRKTSIIFVNAYRGINPAVPLLPGVVEIGGIHIKPASELPMVGILLIKKKL